MTQQIIKEMKTGEMVAEYNKLTGKSIKKFSDRATGEKQLAAARKLAPKPAEKPAATKPTAVKSAWPFGEDGKAAEKPAAKKAEKKPAAKKEPKGETTSRSEGVAQSWSDPKIAEKRSQRNGVQVAGTQYRSVKEAFEELGLPLAKHIAFRLKLKETGKAAFEHEGKNTVFTLTKTLKERVIHDRRDGGDEDRRAK